MTDDVQNLYNRNLWLEAELTDNVRTMRKADKELETDVEGDEVVQQG
jgi:hypothetical protein